MIVPQLASSGMAASDLLIIFAACDIRSQHLVRRHRSWLLSMQRSSVGVDEDEDEDKKQCKRKGEGGRGRGKGKGKVKVSSTCNVTPL